MEGQFHKELSLIRDDAGNAIGVAASGPISWAARETGATISVTITQDGVTARGVTGSEVGSAEHVWALAALVEGTGGLHAGGATAEASASGSTGDGASTRVTWTSPPDPPEIMLRE